MLLGIPIHLPKRGSMMHALLSRTGLSDTSAAGAPAASTRTSPDDRGSSPHSMRSFFRARGRSPSPGPGRSRRYAPQTVRLTSKNVGGRELKARDRARCTEIKCEISGDLSPDLLASILPSFTLHAHLQVVRASSAMKAVESTSQRGSSESLSSRRKPSDATDGGRPDC